MKKEWYQQKTTWTGISMVVGAVGGIMTGVVDVAAGLQTVSIGLIGMFLRQGVENSK